VFVVPLYDLGTLIWNMTQRRSMAIVCKMGTDVGMELSARCLVSASFLALSSLITVR